MVYFPKSYTIYIQIEYTAAPKKGQCHAEIPRTDFFSVKAFGLLMWKDDLPNLYKIESALESDN
jgi:hypothetical protein